MRSKKCPKCRKKIIGYPALSRADNKTEICGECGMKEAMEIAMQHIELPKIMRVIMTRKSENKEYMLKSIEEITSILKTIPRIIEIKKTIELEKEEYEYFSNNLLKESDVIKQNKQYCSNDEDAILVKEKGSEDKTGIVVMCEGFNYARYTGMPVEVSK